MLSIAVKEIYLIFLLIEIFGRKLQNHLIILHCDNLAIVTIINKLGAKCPFIMAILRPLVFSLLRWNITVQAKFLPGKDNFLADLLSRQVPFHPRGASAGRRGRWSPTQLRQIAALADLPTPVPPNLLPENFSWTN